jgi:hypothetical protein
MDAPLGQVARTARMLFSSHEVFPAKFVEIAQAMVQADLDICKERVRRYLRGNRGEKE